MKTLEPNSIKAPTMAASMTLKPIAAVALGLCLLHWTPPARAQANEPALPLAVKLFAPSPDNRIASDGKGLYLDSEPDVLALSLLNFSTREKKLSSSDSRNRKIWVDLGNPALPKGFFDGYIQLRYDNDEFLNCVPSGRGLLTMTPGEPPLYRGLLVEFTDSQGASWRLNFGNYLCGAQFSPCRAMVTPIADNDGDSYADLWAVEPEPGKNSEAILFKLNKKKQWELQGSVSVPFSLVFTREELSDELNSIN